MSSTGNIQLSHPLYTCTHPVIISDPSFNNEPWIGNINISNFSSWSYFQNFFSPCMPLSFSYYAPSYLRLSVLFMFLFPIYIYLLLKKCECLKENGDKKNRIRQTGKQIIYIKKWHKDNITQYMHKHIYFYIHAKCYNRYYLSPWLLKNSQPDQLPKIW